MTHNTSCPHQTYCEMREQTDMRFISHLTRNTFAIILAGGRGTRLKQLTDFRSKPAVPFAGKFRIIDFTLSNCVNSGIRKIGVATQYKAHSLIRHIQRGWSFLDGRFDEFIQLLPAQQQIDENQWYQGTADAVFQNLHFLRHYKPAHILVVAGDHIYKMDYGRMLAEHARQRADMTVACIDVPLAEAREFGVMGSTRRAAWSSSSRSRRTRRPCRATPGGHWPRWASTSSTPRSCSNSLNAMR